LKKILFLGAAHAQVPIIREAKRRGYYIITCDYEPDNPGHVLADEYHNISTTDEEGVLRLAAKVNPDLVLAYASDPAASTAAYVSEKLGLPGNSYESIRLLSQKHLFRDLLKNNRFNYPRIVSFERHELPEIDGIPLEYPVIVKPVDSSGSKGVTVVDSFRGVRYAAEYALSFSRSERIIIEECIDPLNGDLHGDGFFLNGELVFSMIGDHIYNGKVNPLNPAGTSWPSVASPFYIEEIKRQVESIARLAGYSDGPVNIEARINREGKVYIMEIGPRSGGHFVPQAICHATGFNMVDAQLDLLSGIPVTIPKFKVVPTSYFALHSGNDGVFQKIQIDKSVKRYIVEKHIYVRQGDRVRPFVGSHAALGILIMSFPNTEIQRKVMSRMNAQCKAVCSSAEVYLHGHNRHIKKMVS
jgi:biotin carboxylase